jgi:GTP cyclohydrolase II
VKFYPQIVGPIKLPVLICKRLISNFRLYLFRFSNGDYYVLEKGNVKKREWPLVRIQSACFLAHIFNSLRCDCKAQFDMAMSLIHEEGKGLLIYAFAQEGRGVGPFDHVRVYQKQDEGFDMVDSYIELGLPIDPRDYTEIGDILEWFMIKKLKLLTNNPSKIESLERMQFEVKRVPLIPKLNKYYKSQIEVKIKKLGHLIPLSKISRR